MRKILATALTTLLCSGYPQLSLADDIEETAETTQRRAELLAQLAAINAQLATINTEIAQLDAHGAAPTNTAAIKKTNPRQTSETISTATLTEVLVTGRREVFTKPLGQTSATIEREQFKNSSAFSIGELLVLTPGITVAQGNGPRDVSVSVRGSNARQTFGIRNVQVFEDGFPVTQPDGLARTDLIDPHVYNGIDVLQGPASALYGNYATGGMLNFISRSAADISGIELGTDVGRFGYRNHYASAGNVINSASGVFEYSVFASYVAGDGFTNHSEFDTDTVNLLATYAPTGNDKFTVKFVNNNMDTDVSVRLSLNQYRQNPYQQGCDNIAVSGCAPVALFANGFNGPRINTSAADAGIGRHDRRTIAALRWEHLFDTGTTWRTQFVFDNRDIKQPTNSTSAVGTFPSFNAISDLTIDGQLAGFNATHFIGVFANYENINSNTYNVAPGGANGPGDKATQGGQTQNVSGSHFNYGARAREELQFNSQWTGVAGIGIERTLLDATSTAFAYPLNASPTTTRVIGRRDYVNIAPELSAIFQANNEWRLRTRLAAGYGTPQATNLFVTPEGIAGNNTELDPQRNTGLDVGAEWSPSASFNANATVFYERFRNELVSQSPGANLQTYTFNAPRSIHRGFEAGFNWQPLPQLLPGAYIAGSYLRNDQYYDSYTEVLSAGSRSSRFDRAGNKIPGVAPETLHVRIGYDKKAGLMNGLGAFIEADYREAAYADNANLLKIPGYTLYNFNAHYDTKLHGNIIDDLHLFFEIRNLFNRTYVASASNIADTISSSTGLQNPAANVAASSGAIWAGQPRTYNTGVRVKF